MIPRVVSLMGTARPRPAPITAVLTPTTRPELSASAPPLLPGLRAWAQDRAPGRRVWALDGTGSFAAGLAEALAQAGEDVVEVGALKRARGAKNDRLDAVRAARTAMAREDQASPRFRWLREAIGALSATRHGVLVSRTKAINELKSLIVVAPEHLRAVLRGHALTKQLTLIESMTTAAAAAVHTGSPS
jgi:transposase